MHDTNDNDKGKEKEQEPRESEKAIEPEKEVAAAKSPNDAKRDQLLPLLNHLKALLFCLAEHLEDGGKESERYQRLVTTFDKHFEALYHDNMHQEMQDYIEQVVLVESRVGKILRTLTQVAPLPLPHSRTLTHTSNCAHICLTQGHIAPCSTNLKVKLGMENLTKDVGGSWRIIIAIRTGMCIWLRSLNSFLTYT